MKKNIIIAFAIILVFSVYFIIARSNDQQQEPNVRNYTNAELLGNINPATHPQFIRMNSQYQVVPGRIMYLRKKAYEAFIKMHNAAKKEGIDLKIISALRTFNDQKRIWERKYDGKYKKLYPKPVERSLGILMYSSMPGTSRHHWGTDIDINNLDNSYFTTHPYGKKVYQWMQNNASKFGFCMPYSPKKKNGGNRIDGYEMEKWHWSYYPVSRNMLAEYNQYITYEDITNFKGSQYAKSIQVIKRYVNGIYDGCK